MMDRDLQLLLTEHLKQVIVGEMDISRMLDRIATAEYISPIAPEEVRLFLECLKSLPLESDQLDDWITFFEEGQE